MQNLLGLPIQASTHAGDIDQMIVLIHWLMFALFIGWGIFFVFFLSIVRRTSALRSEVDRLKNSISRSK